MSNVMDMIDFIKERKDLYQPKTQPEFVDVPEMKFLMVHGRGMPDPSVGTEEDKGAFTQAVGALYGVAYSIKMSDKKDAAPEGWHNFKVPPLEALWFVEEGVDFKTAKPDEWYWISMVRVPDFVTQKIVNVFLDELVKKKKDDVYKLVKLKKYHEGPSVQMMHIGPYDTEGPDIESMHKYADYLGYEPRGKHHEIYYNDPRRVAPEKLKTVIRQPIKK